MRYEWYDPISRNFQLPLSGSHYVGAVVEDQFPQDLSTPSLGITYRSGRIVGFLKDVAAFNSLSRDHSTSSFVMSNNRPRNPFNSLSRDHEEVSG